MAMGEFAYIERFKKHFFTNDSVYIGIGDDTAALHRTKTSVDLFATDFVIEGTHFTRANATGVDIGWKAMARNISDIAAMGGVPTAAVVGFACPRGTDETIVHEIEKGLHKAAKKFNCPIVGGDMSTARHIVISVAILGRAEKRYVATRAGAETGDAVLCTGTLGGAGAKKHLRFIPRIKEAQFLVQHTSVTSMIDISDGFIQDLSHILHASRKGVCVFDVQVPFSSEIRKAYRTHQTRLQHAFYDGEDYELLFTVPQKKVGQLFEQWDAHAMKTPLTVVGKITREKKIVRLDEAGYEHAIAVKGYAHQ